MPRPLLLRSLVAPLFAWGLAALSAPLAVSTGCTPPKPCETCEDGGPNPGDDLATPPGSDLATPPGSDLATPPADLTTPPDLARPPADPSRAGPRSTVSYSLSVPISNNASLSTQVIGPSEDNRELSKTGAPFPLVILSPGFSLPTSQYTGYAQRLASHGFVVVMQTYRNAGNHDQARQDTTALLGWLITPTGANAARLAGRVDGARVGLTGHSLGGKISLLTAETDRRIKSVITIDPVDGQPPLGAMQPAALPNMKDIMLAAGVPLGFLGETASKSGAQPCTPPTQNYEVLYQAASAPAFAITFVGAGHQDFLDNPNCGFACSVCASGNAPKDRTGALAQKYVAAYFLWTLAGDAGARDYLSGMAFDADRQSGAVTSVSK